MNESRIALIFLICGLAPIAIQTSSNTSQHHTLSGDDAARMVRSLVKQQSKVIDKLQRSVIELDEVITGHVVRDYTHAEYKIRIIRDGDQMRVTNDRLMTGAQKPIKTRDFLVVNEAYVGYYTDGMGTAYIWEHDSPETMSSRARNQITTVTTGHDFRRYGFGTGIGSLAEIFRPNADIGCKVSWIEEKGISTIYEVEVLDEADKDKTITRLTIDAGRGYLVTEAAHYDHSNGGVEVDRISVVPRQFGPGLWLPERCRWVSFDVVPPSDKPTMYRVREFVVRSVDLDISTVPSDFRLEGLGLDRSVTVMRTDTRRRVEEMRFFNGELVPRRLLRNPTILP